MSDPSQSFEYLTLERRLEGDAEVVVAGVRVLDEPACVEGHFPDYPIVPGVAQLVDVVHASILRGWPELTTPSGMKRVKFLAEIRPGDLLEVELIRRLDKESVRFEIRSGGEAATRGSMEFREG